MVAFQPDVDFHDKPPKTFFAWLSPLWIALFPYTFRIPLPRLPKLIPLIYPNLFICNAISILCLLQHHLLLYLHLSLLCHIAKTLLSPCFVYGRSVFYWPWHRHSLAKRIMCNGHKSISNMLRGFYLMGCNPNDTRIIVLYYMAAAFLIKAWLCACKFYC